MNLELKTLKAGSLYRESSGRVLCVTRTREEKLWGSTDTWTRFTFYYLDKPDKEYTLRGKYVDNVVEIK